MNFASITHRNNDFAVNLTPAEMAEYNDYLDTINKDAPLPTPDDFKFNLNLGMKPAEMVECDCGKLHTLRFEHRLGTDTYTCSECLDNRYRRETQEKQNRDARLNAEVESFNRAKVWEVSK